MTSHSAHAGLRCNANQFSINWLARVAALRYVRVTGCRPASLRLVELGAPPHAEDDTEPMSGNSASDSKSVLSAENSKSRLAPQVSETEPEIAGKWSRPARLLFLVMAAMVVWAALIAAMVFIA